MAVKPLWAPTGQPIETHGSISARQQMIVGAADFLDLKETASDYAIPVSGSQPPGLGFTFGDSWKRSQRGAMEFALPLGQASVINHSLRVAFENVFVGKAMRLKTDFTCKGLSNAGADENANTFFDSVTRALKLHTLYRKAMWLYYTVGVVPIVFPDASKSLNYVEILDPRMVRFNTWYGKTYMYLVPDSRMLSACGDPKGTASPFNRDYYNALPKDWRDQIVAQMKSGQQHAQMLIKLKDDSYTLLQNRYTPIDLSNDSFDGCPLAPYFSHAEQYRMTMSGDFASAFLAKNLIALVTIGDPKAEGDNYIRPDASVLQNMSSQMLNPNSAQWTFAESTFNVRYITPDPATWTQEKYLESKEGLKNLLPDCFWSGSNSAFADSAVAIKSLQEEVEQANDEFDRNFWEVIFARAAEGRVRIPKKACQAPKHDKSSLRDDSTWYTANSALYSNGGLDIRSLLESHGYDPETIKARMIEQQAEIKSGIWMPAFESKQGIVDARLQKLGTIPKDPKPGAGAAAPPNKGVSKKPVGAPKKPGARPQPTGSRAPRPSEKK